MSREHDKRYVQLLLKPLKKCADYAPAFGRSTVSVKSVDDFKRMYASDPLYHWVGLDSPLMYAAHKAAGGMCRVFCRVTRRVTAAHGGEYGKEIKQSSAWAERCQQ